MASKKPEAPVPLTPIFDKVIVEPDDQVERSAGGILLPDNLQPPVRRGTVVAVGTEVKHVSSKQRVAWSADVGVEVSVPSSAKKFVVLENKDILAILNG